MSTIDALRGSLVTTTPVVKAATASERRFDALRSYGATRAFNAAMDSYLAA